jgi:hypothetical protein
MSPRTILAAAAPLGLLGLLGLAAGCTDGGTTPAPPGPDGPRDPIDLRAAIGGDPTPTGVAVDPAGRRYVFDEDSGLYEVRDAALVKLLDRGAMPDPGLPVRPPFTDLVALGDDRFAITAIGDGYHLDLAAGTMRPYFCYVPDELPPDYDQRTDAVTYDRAAGLIYAQPRTFDVDGNLLASQVASYSFQTGVDQSWVSVDAAIAAGGMAMVPGIDGPVLGDRTRLLAVTPAGVVELADLADHGVLSVGGLAVDAAAGTLLVLDDANDRLVELALDDVLGR